MFYGRKRELKELNRLYLENKFQLFILYGRRRVGKTALLKEFCKEKEAIFFSVELSNDKMNLEKFSKQVIQYYQDTDLQEFSSWLNALSFIHERQKEKPLVLVLDEFPYLAEKNPSILSTFQHLIDHRLQAGKIFLILCGSYVSFMEREVLGAKSPLFGRRTAQLQLKPFDYLDSRNFLSGFAAEEQCMLYGALGGIPLYLGSIRSDMSFRDNIINLFLNPMGFLYEEPIFMLREEIQQPGIYNAVLEAIAGGASKANEISGKTGEPVAKCLKYIHVLSNLGIVRKETPFGEKESSRRTIYRLEDSLFRFWYRYAAGSKNLIENEAGDIVWQKKIAPNYAEYMGAEFERICREYLIRQNSRGALPFLFTSIGRWWGTDPKTRKQAEIDIIARDEENLLVCECKWRNEKTGDRVLVALKEKVGAYGKQKNQPWLAIFSKSGFTDTLQQEASEDDHLLLFELKDIMYIENKI